MSYPCLPSKDKEQETHTQVQYIHTNTQSETGRNECGDAQEKKGSNWKETVYV